MESGIMRQTVLKEGRRADGRAITEVRPIWSRAGLLPRTHGSALFTRGETQAIAVTTLGQARQPPFQTPEGFAEYCPSVCLKVTARTRSLVDFY